MKKAGILCPEVVILKKHILVLSFIGHDHVPAPKLKDAMLNSEDMKQAYYQVLDVSGLWQTVVLVTRHAHITIVYLSLEL